MKLSFNLNKSLTEKTEGQKVALPVEKVLNEQELATVTGGWGRCGGWGGCCEWDGCGGGHGWWRHHHHWHHRHFW